MSFFKHSLKTSKSFKTSFLSTFSFQKKTKIGTKELVIVLLNLELVINYYIGSGTQNILGES